MNSISASLGIIHLAIIGITLTVPVLLIGLFLLHDPSDLLRKIKDAIRKNKEP